ncbi:MAG: pentapeptide repeat-containing protein [Phormidesmis sp. RL_2_1]|nr:pentapeptide repeat-containing protein [Phormidesmis sp. RL_2_1]
MAQIQQLIRQQLIKQSIGQWRRLSRWLKGRDRRAAIATLALWLGLTFSLSIGWASPAYATNFDRKNLRQQNFSGQDLTDNDYTRADLTEADLSHTNLMGVRLFTTHLDKANLEGANLTGATLDGATLIRANLKDAVLEGAYVISADFRGANIEGADFTDVLFDPRVNKLLCETASGTNPVTGRETRETLFCD